MSFYGSPSLPHGFAFSPSHASPAPLSNQLELDTSPISGYEQRRTGPVPAFSTADTVNENSSVLRDARNASRRQRLPFAVGAAQQADATIIRPLASMKMDTLNIASHSVISEFLTKNGETTVHFSLLVTEVGAGRREQRKLLIVTDSSLYLIPKASSETGIFLNCRYQLLNISQVLVYIETSDRPGVVQFNGIRNASGEKVLFAVKFDDTIKRKDCLFILCHILPSLAILKKKKINGRYYDTRYVDPSITQTNVTPTALPQVSPHYANPPRTLMDERNRHIKEHFSLLHEEDNVAKTPSSASFASKLQKKAPHTNTTQAPRKEAPNTTLYSRIMAERARTAGVRVPAPAAPSPNIIAPDSFFSPSGASFEISPGKKKAMLKLIEGGEQLEDFTGAYQDPVVHLEQHCEDVEGMDRREELLSGERIKRIAEIEEREAFENATRRKLNATSPNHSTSPGPSIVTIGDYNSRPGKPGTPGITETRRSKRLAQASNNDPRNPAVRNILDHSGDYDDADPPTYSIPPKTLPHHFYTPPPHGGGLPARYLDGGVRLYSVSQNGVRKSPKKVISPQNNSSPERRVGLPKDREEEAGPIRMMLEDDESRMVANLRREADKELAKWARVRERQARPRGEIIKTRRAVHEMKLEQQKEEAALKATHTEVLSKVQRRLDGHREEAQTSAKRSASDASKSTRRGRNLEILRESNTANQEPPVDVNDVSLSHPVPFSSMESTQCDDTLTSNVQSQVYPAMQPFSGFPGMPLHDADDDSDGSIGGALPTPRYVRPQVKNHHHQTPPKQAKPLSDTVGSLTIILPTDDQLKEHEALCGL